MLPELLVLFSCTNGYGCSETSSSYFKNYPHVKDMVHEKEKKIKDIMGPFFVQTVAPIIYISNNGTANFYIDSNFGIKINKQEQSLFFRADF